LPNSAISLRLVTPDTTFVVAGRVVRSRIVRLERGGLGYNVAVSFNELLQNLIEEAPVERSAAPSTDAAASDQGVAMDPTTADGDISVEEAAAFESAAEVAPTMMTVTASVDSTGDDLRDLFNGNNW
jgi:hypothetical protein